MSPSEVAATGPLLLALGVAGLAGLVSFFAPCMLPLVPGYLSYVTGLTGIDASAETAAPRWRILAGAAGFVAGFTAVFTLMAYAAGQFGRILLVHARAIEVIVGTLMIGLGLAFAGLIPMRSAKISWLPRAGVAGAPMLGATFALSWTPCLSPTLGVVIGLAAVQGSAARGTALAAAYSLGMGLPFLGVAAGLPRLARTVGFIRRHNQWITRLGGLFLIAVGLALVSGMWTEFVNWLRATAGPGQIGI